MTSLERGGGGTDTPRQDSGELLMEDNKEKVQAVSDACDAGGTTSPPSHVFDGDSPEECLLVNDTGTASEARRGDEALQQRRRVRRLSTSGPVGVPYLIYCCVCLLLTGVLLVTTLWEDFAPRPEVRFWRRRLRPWEEAGEVLVGAALCTETILMFHLDRQAFIRDGWRILDTVIAGLTLLCGIFFCFRRAFDSIGTVIEDLDVPMLGLRFALQPIRMFSTATMVVRAHQRQTAARQPQLDLKAFIQDPRHPDSREFAPALTPQQASDVRELLPTHLRFAQWRLAYSPKVHGTSLNTFYRNQVGPNVLIVRDAHGGLFGGFASEPWRVQAGAYGHSGEAFVFQDRSSQDDVDANAYTEIEESLAKVDPECKDTGFDVFWAPPQRGKALQWGTTTMFGFGRSLVVREDFLRGSTCDCEAFGSGPLSPAGTEFIIRDFECWDIGGSDECE